MRVTLIFTLIWWADKRENWQHAAVSKSYSEAHTWARCVSAGSSTDYEPVCGRPHGVRLDRHGRLIVADSYFGLHSVDPKTGEKTLLLANSQGKVCVLLCMLNKAQFIVIRLWPFFIFCSSGADGVPFAFLNGLEISSQTGIIYFTDSSSRWGRRHVKLEVRRGRRWISSVPTSWQI